MKILSTSIVLHTG